jgi:hypothetical protein
VLDGQGFDVEIVQHPEIDQERAGLAMR